MTSTHQLAPDIIRDLSNAGIVVEQEGSHLTHDPETVAYRSFAKHLGSSSRDISTTIKGVAQIMETQTVLGVWIERGPLLSMIGRADAEHYIHVDFALLIGDES